jgi:hypothetical protein
MNTFTLAHLQSELWLTRKLNKPDLFAGTCNTNAERRERIRAAILDAGAEHLVAGRRKGQTETYGAIFLRIYGKPVNPTPQNTTGEQTSCSHSI